MTKNSTVSVETLLDYLCDQLNCNQKIVASFAGLNESTLSANLKKSLEEVGKKKTGRRLIALYLVIHRFVEKGISPVVIKESINQFVYEDLDGNFDSVVSAVHGDKYSPTVLLTIAEQGLAKYNEKLMARDELYSAVKHVLTAVG